MIRRWVAVLIVVCVCSPADARSTLSEHWLRVQQALAVEDIDAVEHRILEFQQAADDLAVRRLTPYAAALVLWAKDHPGVLADTVVRRARVLDPELPSSYFLLARWQWQRRDWAEGAKTYLAGWWAVFLYRPSREAVIASLGSWLLVVLGWSLVMTILAQAVRFGKQLAHDAVELASLLFRRANAIALAVVILGLPLFVGLGPLWLLAYVFLLTFAYMRAGQRVMALVTLCVLAVLTPALESWQQLAVRSPSVVDRVSIILAERRIDPSTLREFLNLEPRLEGIGSYHLVLGELVRMHGDSDGARLEFQKASLNDASDATPLIFLGNLSMEEGDIARAIQRYNSAIELDARSALAYHNLSSAFDQSRRFQEGDAARDTARKLVGNREGALGIRGHDARIRYPRIGSDELRRLMAEAPAEVGLVTDTPHLEAELASRLLQPSSVVFWASAVCGMLLLPLRKRWMWTAQSCSKCGKVFCPRCKTATESASYCSQCISVFLKRDMVSIEQQSAKLDQIRRWQLWSSVGRRVAGLLVPGSAHVFDDRVTLGLAVGFFAWLFLSGAVIWAPLVLPSVDPLVAVLPLQLVMGVGFLILWLRSIAVAWYRR
jgi:tetratricopeptide (TPR) repeat protein